MHKLEYLIELSCVAFVRPSNKSAFVPNQVILSIDYKIGFALNYKIEGLCLFFRLHPVDIGCESNMCVRDKGVFKVFM